MAAFLAVLMQFSENSDLTLHFGLGGLAGWAWIWHVFSKTVFFLIYSPNMLPSIRGSYLDQRIALRPQPLADSLLEELT